MLVHAQSEDILAYNERSLFTNCNSACMCSGKDWDPVCGDNGITYVSPCLAGCTASNGSGKETVRSPSFCHQSKRENHS